MDTIIELQAQLNARFSDVPAQISDIPRKFRRGSPPMYFNNERPLAWDGDSILVATLEDDAETGNQYLRYAHYCR